MAVMPTQQILLIREVIGLTLFGIYLNASPVARGENSQVQSVLAIVGLGNALNRNEVDSIGPRGGREFTLGQHMSSMGQNVNVGQNGWGLALPVGEDSGLSSDPFNLMHIIEHHQRVRKM